MNTKWTKSSGHALEGRDRKTGALKATGTVVDLVFGSNSQLRSLAEVYAASDAQGKFVADFGTAWTKVMNLGRYDLALAPAPLLFAQLSFEQISGRTPLIEGLRGC